MPFWRNKQAKPEEEDRTVRPEEEGQTLAPDSAPPLVPLRLLSYRVANLQGVGSRARQEDSFTFVNAMDVTQMRENGLLAIMADGMGGMQDGKAASETAIASLRADFLAMDRAGDIPAQLRESALRASERVCGLLGGEGGSTLILCLFYREHLWFACVGDSSLFLLREGQLCTLNRQHNVLTERYLDTIRAKRMDPGYARGDPEKHALTQFLGMHGMDEVDVLLRPLPLHNGDRFLLCSDGVADMVPKDLLQKCMEKESPDAVCASIEQAVLAANNPYQDNYTALFVQCGY